MALAGPGREEKEDLGSTLARNRVALVRLEVGEGAHRGVDLPICTGDPRGPADHEEPGMLLDLVIAELLPRIDADENGASLVLALQDDRRACALRSVDLGQAPALHRAAV